MKKLFYLSILVIVLTGCSISKPFLDLKDVNQVNFEQTEIEEIMEENSEFDAVYLSNEFYQEFFGSHSALGLGSSNYAYTIYRKFVILNADSDTFTTFSVKKNKYTELDSLFLNVTYPSGEKKKFTLEDFEEEVDSEGNSTYKFAYPNIVKGSVIEEGFRKVYGYFYPRKSFHEIKFLRSIPCKNYVYRWSMPDWWKIKVKKIAEDKELDIKITKDVETRTTTYTYKAENLPGLKSEQYSPYFKDVYDYFTFFYEELKMHPYYVTNYRKSDWNSISKQFEQYVMNKDGFFRMKVGTVTDSLIKGIDDDLEKIEAINNYVQKNIEIAEDSKRRNFAQILDDKKGNPFSISGLVHSMLKKCDLDPKFLLVHSAEDGYLDKEFYDIREISIPAVGVLIDGKKYVLFPWLKYLEINRIPEVYQNQEALVVNENQTWNTEYSSKAEFWKLPTGNVEDNTIKENYKLKISENGNIEVVEESILSGTLAYVLRLYLEELEDDKFQEELEESIFYEDGLIDTVAVDVQNLEEYKKPLIVTKKYKIDNLISIMPDEVIFQTSGLFSPTSMKKFKVDTKKRLNPIKISYDFQFLKSIEIELPENWKPLIGSESNEFKNQFGEIYSETQVQDGKLHFKLKSYLNKSNAPKTKYKDLLDIIGSKGKLNIPTLFFGIEE